MISVKLMLLSTILAAVPMVLASENSTLPEIVTDLDDNMVCFLHMWGMRSGPREVGDGYLFGVFDENTDTFVPLVKTVKNNETELASNDEFIEVTRTNSHLPDYDDETDYCAEVEQLIEKYRESAEILGDT